MENSTKQKFIVIAAQAVSAVINAGLIAASYFFFPKSLNMGQYSASLDHAIDDANHHGYNEYQFKASYDDKMNDEFAKNGLILASVTTGFVALGYLYQFRNPIKRGGAALKNKLCCYQGRVTEDEESPLIVSSDENRLRP